MKYFWVLGLALPLAGQAPAYVDAQICASCHSEIAKTYALTGMARSFYRPQAGNIIEDYSRGNPYFHQPSGTWYSMAQRAGEFFQRRWRLGPDGKEINVQESRIDYIMGSGNHVRSYLHQTVRGALIELPLAWYSEDGGAWAMGPGQDRDYTLPPRAIEYECMSCHNSYPSIPAGHEGTGSEALYSGALPQGIDCQRCHGPGAGHVRVARTHGAKVEEIRKSIVNPARLSADRQAEVCLQCHLETTSLPLPHSIRKYDRGPFSYRPGEPLGNFMIFFDHAPGSKYAGDFEIVHSAYKLRESQCFLQSAGRLTCTTCHNPHDIPRGERAAKDYEAACRRCHAAEFEKSVSSGRHTNLPDCTGCHMPKRRTTDVIHAVLTDHLIQRRPATQGAIEQIAERQEFDANQYRGEVVPYYPSPFPQTGENALYAAVAQVAQRSNLEKGLPRLIAEIERRKPVQAEFYVDLGQAWISAGKPASAIPAFEEAARRKPRSAVVLLNLASAMTQAGRLPQAIEVLNRAIKAAPLESLLWYQLGIAQSAAGQPEEAVSAFQRSTSLDPELADAHNLLGAALAAGGDLENAEQELRRALAINPDLPEAQANLGHLCAVRGDLVQAAFYLARSIQLRPQDSEARTNYAVILAGLNRFDEALHQIEVVVKADPAAPEAHNFRGTLLERKGNTDEALKEFLEATRLRPDFALAHRNAARILASRGDVDGAEYHRRQAKAPPP